MVTFVIRIVDFDLENNYDVLTFGTGSQQTTESTIIRLTSATSPNSLIIPGPTIWIRLETDSSYSCQGFFLEVQLPASGYNMTGESHKTRFFQNIVEFTGFVSLRGGHPT